MASKGREQAICMGGPPRKCDCVDAGLPLGIFMLATPSARGSSVAAAARRRALGFRVPVVLCEVLVPAVLRRVVMLSSAERHHRHIVRLGKLDAGHLDGGVLYRRRRNALRGGWGRIGAIRVDAAV